MSKLPLYFSIAISLFLLISCAVSRQVTGPDGEVLHSIDCSGYGLNMGMCLEKASKICGSYGYDILMGNAANYGNSTMAGQWGLYSAPVVSREIIIRCKGGPGTQPQEKKKQKPAEAF